MSAQLTNKPDRKRILLVDPNHEVFVRVMILIDDIAADEYALDWAASFRFGTSLLKRNRYQTCLVASNLGFQTGREFANTARAIAPEVPLIMLENPGSSPPAHEPGDEHLWDRLRLDQMTAQLLCNTLREASMQRVVDA